MPSSYLIHSYRRFVYTTHQNDRALWTAEIDLQDKPAQTVCTDAATRGEAVGVAKQTIEGMIFNNESADCLDAAAV